MSILALTSDTLIGTAAAGNIEYNGQFFGTDSNASRAQLQRITSGTAVASTSGTSIDFTGIPSWVKRITVMFTRVSTNGVSPLIIQYGVGGVPETSGYLGGSNNRGGETAATNGFPLNRVSIATNKVTLLATICSFGSNIWVGSSILAEQANDTGTFSACEKTLAGTLNMIRITTGGGVNTFDFGSINIMYEG
jgi:hypothetical protein